MLGEFAWQVVVGTTALWTCSQAHNCKDVRPPVLAHHTHLTHHELLMKSIP